MNRVIVSCLTVFVCGGCASLGPLNPMASIERKVLFHPTPAEMPQSRRDFESVQIRTAGGEQIHGLLLEHPSAVGTLLFCHGNAGNVLQRIGRLRELRSRHGLTVLGFDYRGYGASDGRASEKAMYEDARSSRKWLAERANVPEADIIVMGRSLGGAVAVELATDGAKGLILESTFSSVADVGQSYLRFLPVGLMVSQRFDSLSKIEQYQGPLLQVHGRADRVVPFELGERLFNTSPSSPKSFVTHEGGHNSGAGYEYDEALATFIRDVAGRISHVR